MSTQKSRAPRVIVLVAAVALGVSAHLGARSPDSAPALPPPGGSVVHVSTTAALEAAVSAASSNQTIMIAPGTYQLSNTLWVQGAKSNVTIRGATTNRNDVVLVGRGMGLQSSSVPFGIWTGDGVTNITIANLTIRDVYQHSIVFNDGTQAPRVYNVRLVDAGEQFIKANPGSSGGVHDGIVEYSVIEYTNGAPSGYTNGVDVHGGRNWIIRHNLFRRIRAANELAGPAVLMWNGAANSVVEGNTFFDCHRDISFGLIERSPNDHTGGVIRNNFIARSNGAGGDVPIAVFDSPGTKVVHNTIWVNGQYSTSIETRFPNTTGVSIVNNLSDRPAQNRDGASASQQGNIWTAASGWFVNAATGNLRLASQTVPAVNAGVNTADAPTDWDLQGRPIGQGFDVGADEHAGSAATADTTAPTVSITSPAAGSSVSGTVTLRANASDGNGVRGVWFTVNGVTIGSEDTTAPYSVNWNSAAVANGARQIRAMARDSAGNVGASPAVTVTVANGGTTAPGSCTTADPFAALGGGTCHNGNWLPPGMKPPTSGPASPATPPSTQPPSSSPVTCRSTRPGPNWTCYNGGWLPPGMSPPKTSSPTTPQAPAAPPTQSGPPSTAPCRSLKPGSGWTCYNGGWLPPGMLPPSGGTTKTPTVSQPSAPSSSGECRSVRPGANWVCRNGNWLPPSYPGV